MHALRHLLPVPGPVWGRYPLRPTDDQAPPRRPLIWNPLHASGQAILRRIRAYAGAWLAMDEAARDQELRTLRTGLRREGLQGEVLAQALGMASATATRTLGLTPRANQLLAARALLDNRMAEMATGEGKTLAIGLAAVVGALAGMPVHVVTANDYLARRDVTGLAPLFQALGLRAAALVDASGDAARRAAYACPLVYATAQDLAFDFLRDGQLPHGQEALHRDAAAQGASDAPEPLMRGLCMALLDEADSILLDEAEIPLILSRSVPHAARRAFLWQALALARQLQAGLHFTVQVAERSALLTPGGEVRVAELSAGLGGPWSRPRYRREAVVTALSGLHACHRDADYVVRDGAIELLDAVTGRVAAGRVWSRGLHTVVALKEGLNAPPETETVAQTTFQRFFQRYWRLSGISGTLWEARGELGDVYGTRVVRVPSHRPSRQRVLPAQRFATSANLCEAVAQRVAGLQAAGRPVLIGTDSVADSLQLSQCLHTRGIAHQVLNALNDAEEARIVARAGATACVTVATRMAGRGTDIEIDAAARAAGGLHVLCCQHNPSRRLDRQLAGRAARHGDPGSVECWSRDDHPAWCAGPGLLGRGTWNLLAQWRASAWITQAAKAWGQWREENRRAALRHTLLEQDRHSTRRLSFAGASR